MINQRQRVSKTQKILNKLIEYGFSYNRSQVDVLIREYNKFEMPLNKRVENILNNTEDFVKFIKTLQ